MLPLKLSFSLIKLFVVSFPYTLLATNLFNNKLDGATAALNVGSLVPTPFCTSCREKLCHNAVTAFLFKSLPLSL